MFFHDQIGELFICDLGVVFYTISHFVSFLYIIRSRFATLRLRNNTNHVPSISRLAHVI